MLLLISEMDQFSWYFIFDIRALILTHLSKFFSFCLALVCIFYLKNLGI